jgi:hypothetical protein
MRHQDLTLNHRLESWVYANAAARTGATGFVAGDVGRIAYQTDTGEYWRLTATTPTWAKAGGSGFGITDGSEAPTGAIGEFKTVTGSAVSLVNSTAKTIATLSLTPGDWDVSGRIVYVNTGGSGVNTVLAGTSLTDNTLGTYNQFVGLTAGTNIAPIANARYNITVTTTIYVIGWSTFTAGTMTGTGLLNARRMR